MKSGGVGGVVERLLLLLGQAGGGLGEGIDGEVTELGRQWMIRKLSDNQEVNCPTRQAKQLEKEVHGSLLSILWVPLPPSEDFFTNFNWHNFEHPVLELSVPNIRPGD